MKILGSQQRGYAERSWLKSYHSFSFGDYWNPEFVNFHNLGVINEDWILGGGGFPLHPHSDMEIITYVIEGAVEHKDNTGGEGVIRPGEIQMMSAGSGIVHSEFNHYKDKDTHLLQIWLHPHTKGVQPRYQQKSIGLGLDRGEWIRIVRPSTQGLNLESTFEADSVGMSDSSLDIYQDAELWVRRFQNRNKTQLRFERPVALWLQVVKGAFEGQGLKLEAGDALFDESCHALNLEAIAEGEILLFVFK